jgi:hypothetical protein
MEDVEADSSIPIADEGASSVPLAPYVGMVFNTIDDAQEYYNEYAKKRGFGTRIACSKKSQKKGCDHLISSKKEAQELLQTYLS